MNNLKSAGSILAALIVVFILSIGTDLLLTEKGMMKMPFQENSTGFISLVVLYRSFYGVIGSYLTASLAPNRPMFHSMIGGCIGFVLAVIGAIVMRDQGPPWYAISIILIALPTAWLGAKMKIVARLND